MIKINNCPVCKKKHIKFHSKVKSNIKTFFVYECLSCNTYFQNPLPTKRELNKLYKDIYNFEHNLDLAEKAFSEFDINQEKGRTEAIKKFKKAGRLLDVGASTGFFLEYLQEHEKFDCYGIEYSKKAVMLSRKKGLNVEHGTLENTKFKNNFFDIITMHSVMEHLPDLNSAMKAINKLIKKKGLFVFNVPNMNSFEKNLYDSLGKPFPGFIYEHIYYFTNASVVKLLNDNNFEVVFVTSRHYSTLNLPPSRPLIGLLTFPFKLFLEYSDFGGKLKKGNILYVYAIKK